MCKGEKIYFSRKTGVSPLIGWIDEKEDLCGFSAADKIVGKASALLFVLCKITSVYACVISTSAIDILNKNNIYYEYSQSVEYIRNRTDTGLCPMEETLKDTEDPIVAFGLLKKKIEEMRKLQQ